MASFSAQVGAWARKTEKRMELIKKEAAQRVFLGVKRRTRVDTGFLRASLMASTSSMPLIDRDARPTAGSAYPDNVGDVTLVIAGSSLDDPIYGGFVASHAAVREYHDAMVRLEAQKWQQTVREVVAEAKARVR